MATKTSEDCSRMAACSLVSPKFTQSRVVIFQKEAHPQSQIVIDLSFWMWTRRSEEGKNFAASICFVTADEMSLDNKVELLILLLGVKGNFLGALP